MVVTHYEVIIIGGGIIGENIAYAIQEDVDTIAILDDKSHFKASHAAGGMLGAQNEFYHDTPLFHFSVEGQQMMKQWDETLKAKGIDIDYYHNGLVKVASGGDEDKLDAQYQFLKTQNELVQRLSQQALKQLTNDCLKDVTNAVWIPMDGQVNAKKYLHGLKTIETCDRYKTEVRHIQRNKGYKVITETHIFTCDRLVIAAGSKSGDLAKLLGYDILTKGTKGEIMTLFHPDLSLKTTIFQTNGHYIVPKANQHYLVGATTSNDQTEHVYAKSIHWLLDESMRLMPELGKSSIVQIDCGFRPETYNQAPIITELDKDLFIATGHYRNGILLSRITGVLMRHLMYEPNHPLAKKYAQHFKVGG